MDHRLKSNKVLPGNSDDDFESDLEMTANAPYGLPTPRSEEDAAHSAWYTTLPYYEESRKFLSSLTYDCLKEQTRQLLDDYSINISISFDDILMVMTIFVLFADSIKIMAVPKDASAGG